MEKESSRGYFLYLIVFLGILNGFGPFVIDMYLPALPEMTHVFNTSAAVIQLGLTFCMVGLAVGQVVLGPISDKFGRKSVLICSLAPIRRFYRRLPSERERLDFYRLSFSAGIRSGRRYRDLPFCRNGSLSRA